MNILQIILAAIGIGVVFLFYAALLSYVVAYTWTRGQYEAFAESYRRRKISEPPHDPSRTFDPPAARSKH